MKHLRLLLVPLCLLLKATKAAQGNLTKLPGGLTIGDTVYSLIKYENKEFGIHPYMPGKVLGAASQSPECKLIKVRFASGMTLCVTLNGITRLPSQPDLLDASVEHSDIRVTFTRSSDVFTDGGYVRGYDPHRSQYLVTLAFKKGDRVVANYKGEGTWYPASYLLTKSESLATVIYDDSPNKCKPCNWCGDKDICPICGLPTAEAKIRTQIEHVRCEDGLRLRSAVSRVNPTDLANTFFVLNQHYPDSSFRMTPCMCPLGDNVREGKTVKLYADSTCGSSYGLCDGSGWRRAYSRRFVKKKAWNVNESLLLDFADITNVNQAEVDCQSRRR